MATPTNKKKKFSIAHKVMALIAYGAEQQENLARLFPNHPEIESIKGCAVTFRWFQEVLSGNIEEPFGITKEQYVAVSDLHRILLDAGKLDLKTFNLNQQWFEAAQKSLRFGPVDYTKVVPEELIRTLISTLKNLRGHYPNPYNEQGREKAEAMMVEYLTRRGYSVIREDILHQENMAELDQVPVENWDGMIVDANDSIEDLVTMGEGPREDVEVTPAPVEVPVPVQSKRKKKA
jgi:hypothetical protein